MSSFFFEGRFHLTDKVWVWLDCEYVSNGPNEDPSIRVHGANKGDNPGGSVFECVSWEIDRGEPHYETLLAQAEAHGAKCIEADEAFEDQCYRERHATRNDDIRKDRAAVAAE